VASRTLRRNMERNDSMVVTCLTTSKPTLRKSCETRMMTTMTVSPVTTEVVLPAELVMVKDEVNNDVAMAVEVATMEATMEQEVSTADEPMALKTDALVVFVVLQDFVLIKRI